jgi:hypothetical protein
MSHQNKSECNRKNYTHPQSIANSRTKEERRVSVSTCKLVEKRISKTWRSKSRERRKAKRRMRGKV